MTTPRFSSDPVQQAEMLAEHYAECRFLGINPRRFEPEGLDDEPDREEPDWDDQDDDGQPDEAQEWHDFDPDC